ncbi:MAG: SpoIIE family protein phosphatase [Gammaproteobacteria bacterium]|nr:SpoIIE family protein phosphatase [Gammaproteobacteria bacterium]
MKSLEIEAHGSTDIGQLRSRNEDSFLVDSALHLYAVADGMGGHRNGAEASAGAIAALVDEMARLKQQPDSAGFDHDVEHVIAKVNDSVFELNRSKGQHDGSGMGTTLVGMMVDLSSCTSTLFNVGDSRAYLYRKRSLTQLTRDQTVYQEWIDGGGIGPEPGRNLILQGIGLVPEITPKVDHVQLDRADMIILCSDGLNGSINDQKIAQILSENHSEPPFLIVERLIDAANAAGGEDNISVVVLKVH